MQQPATPSRRQALATGLFGVTAALTASAALSSPANADTGPAAGQASSGGDRARTRARARALVRRMSLEDKVGQLFVVEVYGQSADTASAGNRTLYGVDTPAEVIAKYRPGGVIYFDARRGPDNVRDPLQTARLSNGLQRAARRAGARVPLLVSIDQEGGSVVYRLTDPATLLPGNMALAAGRSASDTRRSAEILGLELAAMGVNQNYAPVADVNVNPENPVIGVRSFGSDPALCASLVDASVSGYHRGRVASAAKHFPGHGDTDTDSHTGLPRIDHTREELENIDLPPFRAAIARGVDTIMTAHIVVPALDPSGVPATMSRPIVTGLLRQEMGFEGLIVTDALDMQGASGQFPPDVAPVRALMAGCDQLVLAPELDTAYGAVLEAVRSGQVPVSRLDASVERILAHKLRRDLFRHPYVDERHAVRTVGAERHKADAQAITDRTVTLVRNEGSLLPLSSGARSVLVTGWGVSTTRVLADAVAERPGQSATVLETGAIPSADRITQAAGAAAGRGLVIVSVNAAAAGSEKGAAQARLVQALMDTGAPVVAVAVRNPYDIRRFPGVPAYLATYSYGAPSLRAAVRTVYGGLSPAGRLPVAVPDAGSTGTLYPFGHGLTY
ncbi:glycoside hydrolase family 3 protein [Streptomyces chitinivorans]|uniref:beta-N-acetylhexosaminidase n=1 Tax=Streptomyces chitinivorans TaxID=1257027 RepID=A0ABW7HNA2_9ACTN|nr:glycoside hydrolase family 3 protein [Streptomyces chitinivorans]MDH2411145.1 glycoside hydrolase family 3 N-terminal domain-containing protein [Streptomyces chitinivorans]